MITAKSMISASQLRHGIQDRINIDFRQTLQNAEMLEEAAREMEQTVKENINNAMLAVTYGWNSEHAVVFMRKYESLYQDILKTTKDLKKAADSIRTAAIVIYAAEYAAVKIALNKE